MIFDKNVFEKKLFFLNLSRSSRARTGPIQAHMGPYGPIWSDKSQKVHRKIALTGAFKRACHSALSNSLFWCFICLMCFWLHASKSFCDSSRALKSGAEVHSEGLGHGQQEAPQTGPGPLRAHSTQGSTQGPFKGPYYMFFHYFLFFLIQVRFYINIMFCVGKMCLLDSSSPRHKTMQNHLEIISKKQFLDPNCAKLHQKSELGHVCDVPKP